MGHALPKWACLDSRLFTGPPHRDPNLPAWRAALARSRGCCSCCCVFEGSTPAACRRRQRRRPPGRERGIATYRVVLLDDASRGREWLQIASCQSRSSTASYRRSVGVWRSEAALEGQGFGIGFRRHCPGLARRRTRRERGSASTIASRRPEPEARSLRRPRAGHRPPARDRLPGIRPRGG